MPPDPARGPQAGFTMVEILVALIIAGMGLAAVSGLLSSGLTLSTTSARVDRETALARSAMERFGQDMKVEPGVRSGEAAEGYRWRSEVAVADPTVPPEMVRTAIVTVTVWDKNESDAGVRLTSLRLLLPDGKGQP
jgi:prepilin-type N-terminal cleavage/methylation domain-containing protein